MSDDILVFLDLDGVFNNTLLLFSVADTVKGGASKHSVDDLLCIPTRRGEYFYHSELERMAQLQVKYGFKIIGTGSFFRNQDCIDLWNDHMPFIVHDRVSCTGGGIGRARAIVSYINTDKWLAVDDSTLGYELLDSKKCIHPDDGLTVGNWRVIESILEGYADAN